MESGCGISEAVGRLFAVEYSKHMFEKYKGEGIHPDINNITKAIHCARITNVWYDFETKRVYFQMERPGIFIGVRGADIDATTKFLEAWAKEVKIPFEGIKIKEDLYSLNRALEDSVYTYSLCVGY
jgi:ribosomal protein S3